MTHLKDNIALADVPKHWTRNISIDDGVLFWYNRPQDYYESEKIDAPGTWRFVALSTEMTEEQAEQIVEAFDQVVVTYYRRYGKKGEVCYTALESFTSLLTSLGCDPAGTYAVLVKNERV